MGKAAELRGAGQGSDMNAIVAALARKHVAKLLAGGVGAILAAIGGVTTIKAVQPAVEKASDYGARAVEIYCELPQVDRDRFRSEVMERLTERARSLGTSSADIRVTCPLEVLSGGR